jgi:glycosyltransferase involved in cell wall biosynthesis
MNLEHCIEGLRDFCRSVTIAQSETNESRLKWYTHALLNLLSPLPLTVRKHRSRRMRREIMDLLASHDFDVIHFDSTDVAQYRELTDHDCVVLNHHNFESDLLARRGRQTRNPLMRIYLGIQARKLRSYEHRIIRSFAVNLCVTKLDAENLKRLYPEGRYEVIPNGTDTEYFRPVKGHDPDTLVFAGPMSWYPNRDAMLYFVRQVLPRVRQRRPDTRMIIIGRSPGVALQRLAANDADIELTGFVNDIRPLVARAAVYVVPLRVGGGSRLKILDAMACGRAVVSTSIGCEGLDVTDQENILIADSPKQFADAVLSVLEDDGLRERIAAKGRRLVEVCYSWEKIAGLLEDSYLRYCREE